MQVQREVSLRVLGLSNIPLPQVTDASADYSADHSDRVDDAATAEMHKKQRSKKPKSWCAAACQLLMPAVSFAFRSADLICPRHECCPGSEICPHGLLNSCFQGGSATMQSEFAITEGLQPYLMHCSIICGKRRHCGICLWPYCCPCLQHEQFLSYLVLS